MTLEQQAEAKFPIPEKACPYKVKKILWLRERWIKEQKAGQ
jgi:hypothetical protein